MGLCKCVKRKVTQNFCFEHKVNVCEFCMIHDHPKCIVQPYLRWLEDSSYESICQLCQHQLFQDECIRLLCYHIFHTSCLNKFVLEKCGVGATGDQISCPDCHKSMIPALNSLSPVANEIRQILSRKEWAPVTSDSLLLEQQNNGYADQHASNDRRSSSSGSTVPSSPNSNLHIPQIIHQNDHSSPSSTIPINVPAFNYGRATNTGHDHHTTADGIHRVSSSGMSESHVPLILDDNEDFDDNDEDKYKSKPASEFISRWFRNRMTTKSKSNSNMYHHVSTPGVKGQRTFRTWIVVGILLVVAVLTLIHYVIKMGREHADSDPSLDPAFNPNIRVENNNHHRFEE